MEIKNEYYIAVAQPIIEILPINFKLTWAIAKAYLKMGYYPPAYHDWLIYLNPFESTNPDRWSDIK